MPPSTTSASSTLVNAQSTLSLKKFSHCTVAHLSSPLQWNHLRGQNDLYAVFDTVREMDICEQMMEKHVLRVFQGRTLYVGISISFNPHYEQHGLTMN